MKQPCRFLLAWLSLLLSFSLLLSGCGNNPNPRPLHDKRADGSPWIVRYAAMPDDIRSLDPQVSYDMVSSALLEPIYDTLLSYDPMKTDPYEVKPQMLAGMPERTANPDGTVTYLCRLQKDIHFHDDPCFPNDKGREVTAADVHYAFLRICDPAVESPFEGPLADYIAGMANTFAAASKSGKLDYDATKLRGLEVVDRYTFKLHLLKAYPQILYWLTMFNTAPVAREAVEYYDGKEHEETFTDPETGKARTGKHVRPLFKFHPVGTGPFYIHDRVAGQRYRLVRVEGYHTERFPTGGWPAEREASDAFATAALTDHGEGLPFADRKRDTLHGFDRPGLGDKINGQVADVEERFGGHLGEVNSKQ
jgi:ABC-type transport system substrate-binding protein